MTEQNEKKPSVFADLDKLRLAPGEFRGGRELEVDRRIAVRKPSAREFFRVHPDPGMSLDTTIITDRDGMQSDVFFVAPDMRTAFSADVRPALLLPTMTLQGVLMIWPLMLPMNGRPNDWQEGTMLAAERARRGWVRMAADVPAGCYRIFEAIGEFPEPEWPAMSLQEMLDVAFAGMVIDGEDHPLVRRLRGAA
jgi:hypothetical protein